MNNQIIYYLGLRKEHIIYILHSHNGYQQCGNSSSHRAMPYT